MNTTIALSAFAFIALLTGCSPKPPSASYSRAASVRPVASAARSPEPMSVSEVLSCNRSVTRRDIAEEQARQDAAEAKAAAAVSTKRLRDFALGEELWVADINDIGGRVFACMKDSEFAISDHKWKPYLTSYGVIDGASVHLRRVAAGFVLDCRYPAEIVSHASWGTEEYCIPIVGTYNGKAKP